MLRGAPATPDHNFDFLEGGRRRGPAQRTKKHRIKVGDPWNPVIEDRCAVGDDAVSLPNCTTVLAVEDYRRDNHQQAGDKRLGHPTRHSPI